MINNSRHILLFLTILLKSIFAFSQTAQQDSLQNPTEYNKVISFEKKANEALQKNDVTAFFVNYNKALKITEAASLKYKQADVLHSMARIYSATGQNDTAIVIFTKAAKIRREIKDYEGLNKTLTNISSIYQLQAKYDEAIIVIEEAIEVAKKAEYKRGLGIGYQQLGNALFNKAIYDVALQNYEKAIEIFEELDFDKGITNCYNGIAAVYQVQEQHKNSYEYFLKSYKKAKEKEYKLEMANAAVNIGSYYGGDLHLNKSGGRVNLDSLFYYYNEALEKYKELEDYSQIVTVLINIGVAHSINKDFVKAEARLKEANQYITKYNILSEKGNLLQAYAMMNLKSKKYTLALDYFMKASLVFIEYGQKEKLLMNYKRTSEAYDSLRNYKDAYKYIVLYSDLNDTLRDQATRKSINTFINGQSYKEKLKELETAEQRENDLRELNETQQRFNLVLKIGLGAIAIFLILVFYQFLQKRKANKTLTLRNQEILQQKEEIEVQRNQVLQQKDIIEEQQHNILDSIQYARRIQEAILPHDDVVKELFGENISILFKPRDIVSGDFYWMGAKENKQIVVAADCTGHGVPGAFMSMLGTAFLNEIINGKVQNLDPGTILNLLRQEVIMSLGQTGKTGEQKDGMDLALYVIDRQTKTLEFAGANNPLVIVRPFDESVSQLEEDRIKIQEFESESNSKKYSVIQLTGNKMPIGIYANQEPFTTISLKIQEGDLIYVFSDGYQDQFGGEKGKKFMIKKLKQLFVDMYDFDMKSQQNLLDKTLLNWIEEGNTEQVDDILVIGNKI